MSTSRFQIKRIPAPEWASAHDCGEQEFVTVADEYYGVITPTERDALLKRHADILNKVDEIVEEYVNNSKLCSLSREDWFPQQSKLTGEFYIGKESYYRLAGQSWVQICVKARCIGEGHRRADDYLGLSVWLRFDPKSGRLQNNRNTDSMSI